MIDAKENEGGQSATKSSPKTDFEAEHQTHSHLPSNSPTDHRQAKSRDLLRHELPANRAFHKTSAKAAVSTSYITIMSPLPTFNPVSSLLVPYPD